MAVLRFVRFAVLVGLVAGQYDGWDLEKGQVSADMCYWDSPRAAVIRDTLWLDGGKLYWTPTYRDGSEGPPTNLDNSLGLMYSLNFSKPFDKNTNLTKLIETKSKAAGGSGNVNSYAPNTIDGALLHNDAEFFLYGGVLGRPADGFDPSAGNKVMAWRLHAYGPDKPSFQNGSSDMVTLKDDITRYVAYGGAASAPSENKAWYVGGMRSPIWGEMYMGNPNRSLTASNDSNFLITLDMSEQLFEKFSNQSLPSRIRARANPEVVWVPVGAEGILVVLGGVTYPEYVNITRKSADAFKSQQESPAFMETIDIYDVAGGNWYQQKVEGPKPPALTRGCAVLAPAQDHSSFNIYYYGGYDGINAKEDFSDDVWVLSIPSFQWTKVYEGKSLHARAGHQCVMPYPDQMMVIGGYTPMPGGGPPPCLDGGIIQVFNLSSAKWLDGYSPSKWSNYTIPAAVIGKIGGDGKGSATKTQPEGSGWADPSLEAIFAKPYETSKIQTWYPYTESKETPRPTVPGDENNGGGGGGGTPPWVAPVLGVVLGLVFVTAILVGFCLWRRRRILRRGNGTATQTDDNGSRIISWIRGQPSEPIKAPTVTTEEIPSTHDMAEVRTPPPAPATSPVPYYVAHEVADNQIAELPDTSPRAELHGVGLTPVEIINKHTHFGAGTGAGSNPATTHQSSYYASVSSNENASSLSRSSGVLGYPTRAQSPEPGPPSPPISTAALVGRVASEVSGLSDRDGTHLRNLSGATVSSASSGGEQSGQAAAREQLRGVPDTVPETPTPGHPSPLSPPTGASDGEDYISARMMPVSPAGTATLRRSMFHESEDDLGSRK